MEKVPHCGLSFEDVPRMPQFPDPRFVSNGLILYAVSCLLSGRPLLVLVGLASVGATIALLSGRLQARSMCRKFIIR